jgi:cytidine deaminase
MDIIENKIKITVIETAEDYPKYLADLMSVAIQQLDKAYAPYSNFHVGAAALTTDDAIFKGCNQENASYPLCICAERVALYNFGVNSESKIKALAVVARNPAKPLDKPVSPCGACRQVILEFEQKQNSDIVIFLKGESDIIYQIENAKQLLPFSFDKSSLL